MLLSTIGFGLMAVTIRLASKTESTLEIAFFRNFFGLIALLPLLLGPVLRTADPRAAWRKTVHTTRLSRYGVRALIGFVGMFLGFWSIANLPLSQAIALAYSSPIFVTIAAVLMLGEVVRARRWAAVTIGFIGMLVIVRPFSHTFTLASLVAVSAAITSAIVAIQIKQLSTTDGPDTIVFWTYVLWVPMSLVAALFQWHWPQGITWVWLILTGVLGTIGQVMWTRALKLGEVSALTPISFVQLVVVTIAGWLLFDEHVDRWTLIGAGIIFASTAYIAHREAQLARLNRSNAASEATEAGR
ncbi:MAG: EamA family transporter [Proteobacteria bacterium]|nr:EamA family transporter [Pseudomonadota bacterium]